MSETIPEAFRPPALETLAELIPRYDRPGPRYTSYPTAPVWQESFGPGDLRDALGRVAQRNAPLSLYVHVPFCEQLCTYCACNRVIQRDHAVAVPYLDHLEREMAAVAEAVGGGVRHGQLAIGGGTPTYLDPDQLARMCDALDAHFPPEPGAERSIEVDPRVTSAEQLAVLADRGFNRVSLGVQDLSDVVQRAIRRVQSLEQTAAVAETARSLGFGSVNFDLIYGLPFQTPESFEETVREVIALQPDRIALYGYAHVTWVSKQQRGFERQDLPGPERKLAIFLAAIRLLTEAGYRFLGLDHFARPGDDLARAAEEGTLQRNFMGYTTRRASDLVGFGPSAISELADVYAQSLRDPGPWGAAVDADGLATQRGWRLDDDDLRRKWLIQALMCRGEIDPGAYAERFDEALEDRVPGLADHMAPFEDDGLLVVEDGAWHLSFLGRLFLRNIAMTFDAHLAPPSDGQKRYSRTV
ncbi:MAG: oxygen-independent coproporphyrinogen III oxidase [Deltaproteobacteria bacterium]|nr:oxygen-independent coproporphyrinogen III oxidase [Deltaproteobacteria bacterium]